MPWAVCGLWRVRSSWAEWQFGWHWERAWPRRGPLAVLLELKPGGKPMGVRPVCHGYLCSTGAPAHPPGTHTSPVLNQMSSPLPSQGKQHNTAALLMMCLSSDNIEVQSLSVLPSQVSPPGSGLGPPAHHRARDQTCARACYCSPPPTTVECWLVRRERRVMTNGVAKTGSPGLVVVSPLPPDTNAAGLVRLRARCM